GDWGWGGGGGWETGGGGARGLELAGGGADLADVGGESPRPGAGRVDEAEELRRVGPVVAELARAGLTVSVDTMRAGVAELALEAGARMVNDVSGGRSDPRLPRLVAQGGGPYAIMPARGPSRGVHGRLASEATAPPC